MDVHSEVWKHETYRLVKRLGAMFSYGPDAINSIEDLPRLAARIAQIYIANKACPGPHSTRAFDAGAWADVPRPTEKEIAKALEAFAQKMLTGHCTDPGSLDSVLGTVSDLAGTHRPGEFLSELNGQATGWYRED